MDMGGWTSVDQRVHEPTKGLSPGGLFVVVGFLLTRSHSIITQRGVSVL